MFSRARKSSSSEWPFWLLLGAWVCANTPQIAIFTVVAWLAEGRTLTHQQRLTQDVARLLAGEKPTTPFADAVAKAKEHLPKKQPTPTPADGVMKKLELSLETTCEVLPVALQTGPQAEAGWTCPEARRKQPPHGPPREGVA